MIATSFYKFKSFMICLQSNKALFVKDNSYSVSDSNTKGGKERVLSQRERMRE